jgi:hypothetical protein
LGFDGDPQRVKDALENVKKNGLADFITINKQNIGEVDFKDASLVVLHLSSDMNLRLMPQLAKLKPGTRVVSDDFVLKGVKPAKKISLITKGDKPGGSKEHTLFLWIVPWEME